MGRNPTGQSQRKYQIEQLWDIHKEICRRIALGQKNVDIAKELGVTEVMVSYTRNSTLGIQQRELLHAREDERVVSLGVRIKEMAPKALDVLEQILDNAGEIPIGPKLQAKVAESILDRAGYGAIQRSRNENVITHLTREDIDELKQRAAAAGYFPSEERRTIDVETTSEAQLSSPFPADVCPLLPGLSSDEGGSGDGATEHACSGDVLEPGAERPSSAQPDWLQWNDLRVAE